MSETPPFATVSASHEFSCATFTRESDAATPATRIDVVPAEALT
ncbi:MAG TPA: hypothetical protein VHU90_05990 [Galbitalea sp.]|nr:hypothetical protein [Galbitalea sp.]